MVPATKQVLGKWRWFFHIEVKVASHKLSHFKMYNPVAPSALAVLCNHDLHLVQVGPNLITFPGPSQLEHS